MIGSSDESFKNLFRFGKDMKDILAVRKGQELFQTLSGYLTKNGVKTGLLTGLGACSRAELGYYRHDKRDYERIVLDKNLEIACLTGNISILDGKPFVHIHTTLSDERFNVYGGHLFSALADPLIEVAIMETNSIKTRKFEESLGLYLIS